MVAVFYSFQDSDWNTDEGEPCRSGIVVVENHQLNGRRLRNSSTEYVESELELLNRFIDIVVDFDPDILCGWEVQAASWGYLGARGRVYGMFLCCFPSS